jgi:hypothetical protein
MKHIGQLKPNISQFTGSNALNTTLSEQLFDFCTYIGTQMKQKYNSFRATVWFLYMYRNPNENIASKHRREYL